MKRFLVLLLVLAIIGGVGYGVYHFFISDFINEGHRDHTYDNACDAFCNDCGEKREVSAHQWNDATCTSLKTCTVCGYTEGEMLPHNWEDATCITAKTCKTCGTTEGEPLGHKPAEDDGDCTTAVKCTNCGYIFIEAMEHNFSDDLSSNKTYHYYACLNGNCLAEKNAEEHYGEDDGDCTTHILCECGWLIEEGNESHTPEEDDGNCATAQNCVNCEQIAVAGREHIDADHDFLCDNTGCQITVGNPPKDENDGIDLPIDRN